MGENSWSQESPNLDSARLTAFKDLKLYKVLCSRPLCTVRMVSTKNNFISLV